MSIIGNPSQTSYHFCEKSHESRESKLRIKLRIPHFVASNATNARSTTEARFPEWSTIASCRSGWRWRGCTHRATCAKQEQMRIDPYELAFSLPLKADQALWCRAHTVMVYSSGLTQFKVLFRTEKIA